MLQDILTFIITGIPHSGTTPLSDIFRNVPGLYSCFECGFLFYDKPAEFLDPRSKYYDIYYKALKRDWKLSDHDIRYIMNTEEWEDVYTRLRERSLAVKDKNVCLFDKTPHYINHLDEIIEKINGIPVIVILKDIRLQYFAYKRRKRPDIQKVISFFNDELAEKLLRYESEGKIYILRYEDMCLKCEEEIEKVFKFIGLGFHSRYLDFVSIYQPQYGKGIQAKYVSAYKNNLSKEEINKIKGMVKHPLFYYELNGNVDSTMNFTKPSIYTIAFYMEHRQKAYEMLNGGGLEIGAFNQAAILADSCPVVYCDVMSKEEAIQYFPEQKPENIVEVDHIIDLNKQGLSIFQDQEFDFVIANRIIEHIVNPIYALKEIFRVVKTKGLVVISVFDKEYSIFKSHASTPFRQIVDAYTNKVDQINDELYLQLLKRVKPQIFDANDKQQIANELKIVRERREHIYLWDSKDFKTFLMETFNLINITPTCVYESEGTHNKTEYFSVWQKQ